MPTGRTCFAGIGPPQGTHTANMEIEGIFYPPAGIFRRRMGTFGTENLFKGAGGWAVDPMNEMRKTRRARRWAAALLALAVAAALFVLPTLYRGRAAKPAMAGSSLASSAEPDPLLLLVNASHPLPADYQPALAQVNIAYFCSPDKDNRMDSRAVPFVEQMAAASRRAGASVVLVSGYRSHAYQKENFDRSVSRWVASGAAPAAASAIAAESIALPGTSEHETGLAVDVCSAGWFVHNSDLTAGFDQTAAFRWLSAHAAEYGFILRYPLDKTAVTGITYEPWHYRFVGTANAEKIAQSGLCLEEYLAEKPR